jgi:hypothetical protein
MWSEVQGGVVQALTDAITASETLRTVVSTKFHDISSVNINANSGAFVEVRAVGALPSDVTRINMSYTAAQPLQFRAAADAAAAAALSSDLFVANQGDTIQDMSLQISAGAKLWVRSLSATAVTSGYITMNLLG